MNMRKTMQKFHEHRDGLVFWTSLCALAVYLVVTLWP
jgi:hypothetical protein